MRKCTAQSVANKLCCCLSRVISVCEKETVETKIRIQGCVSGPVDLKDVCCHMGEGKGLSVRLIETGE